jgi:TonB family protein
VKSLLPALAFALLSGSAFAQTPPKPILYNDLEGDGGVEIDQAIKRAYGPGFTIVDTGASQGYTGPVATRGDLPTSANDEGGHPLLGYALIVYIVTADGRVASPEIVRANDLRLNQVALEAMSQWRFTPATVHGQAVASTAAQEFNFGPIDVTNGFHIGRVVVYQTGDVLLRRMPPEGAVQSYITAMVAVAHRFLVGDPQPENLDLVVVIRPGGRSRVWFHSTARPDGAPAWEPLRRLLQAVPTLEVKGGPVILTLSGFVAGGAPGHPAPEPHPIPEEWQALERTLPQPLPFSSDAFLDLLWPGP